MKTPAIAGLLVLLACGAVGYAQFPKQPAAPGSGALSPADIAAIRAASATYVRTALGKDWTAWIRLFDADAIMMPPHGAAQSGLAAIEQGARGYPPFRDLVVEPLEFEGRGDLAIVRGRYAFTLTPPGEPAQSDTGKYIEIWRRHRDASWKLWRDIFNSDLPVPAAAARAAAPRILRLTYMNVEPAKVAAYIARLREHFLPIHSHRVNQGRLVSWKAYQVEYPNGEQSEYNFVIATEVAGYAQLEPDAGYAAAARATVGAERYEQVLADPIAKNLRTDTLVLRETTQSWASATNRFLNVAFLKALPGKGPELLTLLRTTMLGINEDNVAADRMRAWAAASVRFPEQRDPPYTHLTLAGYDSLAELEKPSTPEHRQKWDAPSAEFSAKLPTLRIRVKGELWRLVGQTTPAAAPRQGT